MHFASEPTEILQRARDVRLLLLDVDGVLTAGELFLSDSGEEMKAFSTPEVKASSCCRALAFRSAFSADGAPHC